MTSDRKLLEHVRTLMRVMLVSERTSPEHQHVIRFNALDFHTLGLLRDAGSARASALAEAMGIAPTTASSLIARLVKRGLIARTQSAKDGRAYDLTLTEEGHRIADAIQAQDLRNMRTFLSALSPRDQETLIGLLEQVVDKVQSLEADAKASG